AIKKNQNFSFPIQIFPICDSNSWITYLPLITQGICSNLCSHALLIEGTFWQPVAGKEMLSSAPLAFARTYKIGSPGLALY
uniref:Uncharacterized protein n=1 Tax=Xenopus tropicalis TaxID=8364 RepID=A0A6I8SLW3_XENTR